MASCPTFAICPASDGTVKSCQSNCACVYCGNTSMVNACNAACVSSGGGVSASVNTQPATDAINGAINGALAGIIAPLQAGIVVFLERAAIFLFAMVLVVVGFLVVKQ